jgi:ATP-dependent Zn protease
VQHTLQEERTVLEALAKLLIEKEVVDREALVQLLGAMAPTR